MRTILSRLEAACLWGAGFAFVIYALAVIAVAPLALVAMVGLGDGPVALSIVAAVFFWFVEQTLTSTAETIAALNGWPARKDPRETP